MQWKVKKGMSYEQMTVTHLKRKLEKYTGMCAYAE